jgi:hypothetical protein
MTPDEIFALAKRVGFPIQHPEWRKAVEEFAALVEEKATEKSNARANSSWTLMCEKMVVLEREACAKLLESRKTGANDLIDAVRDLEAQAIRARGQA